ncbi:hypothetical protein ColKHC_09967 [Colletotrichum higginsianum]|nr:hypothetical protein ColKHC_09967 [Colletotrichum higginsianum]
MGSSLEVSGCTSRPYDSSTFAYRAASTMAATSISLSPVPALAARIRASLCAAGMLDTRPASREAPAGGGRRARLQHPALGGAHVVGDLLLGLLAPPGRHQDPGEPARGAEEAPLDGLEEGVDVGVGHLAHGGAEGDDQHAEEHRPRPLRPAEGPRVKGLAALPDDDHLAGDGGALDAEEPRVAQDALVPDVEAVVDAAAVVLVEELHPDVDVEDHGLQRRAVGGRGGAEEGVAGVVQGEHDGELVDGLAEDHLPHGDVDDGRVARLGAPLEEVRGRVVRREAEGGEDVHDEVDPEELHDRKHGVAGQLRDDRESTGRDVDGELELDDHKSFNDGGKVVVEQDDGRRLLGDLGALDAHGEAHVGGLQGQGVVGAVARDGDRLPHALEVRDEQQLVLRARPRQHLEPGHDEVQLRRRELPEGGAVHGEPAGRVDAALGGDGLGRQKVVARDHAHEDAGLLALAHRVEDLGPEGVADAEDADERHVAKVLLEPDRVRVVRPLEGRRGVHVLAMAMGRSICLAYSRIVARMSSRAASSVVVSCVESPLRGSWRTLVHCSKTTSAAPLTSSRKWPLGSLDMTAIHFLEASKGNMSAISLLALSSFRGPMERNSRPNRSIAVSVLVPTKPGSVGLSLSKAVEFRAMLFFISSLTSPLSDSSSALGVTSWLVTSSLLGASFLMSTSPTGACSFDGTCTSPNLSVRPSLPVTTVMLFCVRVPVLSEQIHVALPMISHERIRRTRFLSLSILVVAKASASVTARARPSGTVMTTTVTARMSSLKKVSAFSDGVPCIAGRPTQKRMNRMRKKMTPAMAPKVMSCFASLPSFCWRGVSSTSSLNDINVLPYVELLPTEVTRYAPTPPETVVPLRMKGRRGTVGLLVTRAGVAVTVAGDALVDEFGLARERGLVHLDAGPLDEHAVDGDDVPRLDVHDVADLHVVHGDVLRAAGPDHLDVALLLSLDELGEPGVLLPVRGGAGKDDDEDGHHDRHAVDPLDVGLVVGRVDRLVDAQRQRDGRRQRQEEHELVVEGDPREPQKGLLPALRKPVLAVDAPPVDEVLALVLPEVQVELEAVFVLRRGGGGGGGGGGRRRDGRDLGGTVSLGGGDGLLEGDCAVEAGLVDTQAGGEVCSQSGGETGEAAEPSERREAAGRGEFVELRRREGELVVFDNGLIAEVELVVSFL